MDLLLHIGMPKTASTTLQRALADSRGYLTSHSIIYPKSLGAPNNRKLAVYAISDNREFGLHVRFNAVTTSQRARFRSQLEDEFKQEMAEAQAQGYGLCIISNEHLWALQSEEELKRLKDFISPLFDKIEIVVYLRRQDEQIISLYSTSLTSYSGQTEPLDLTQQHPENYYKKLSLWSDFFNEKSVKIRVFSKEELINENIIDDFCCLINLSPAPLNENAKRIRNSSIKPAAQEFIRILNRTHPRIDRDQKTSNDVSDRVIPIIRKNFAGTGVLPTHSDARAYYEKARASNNRIARRWLNRDALFREDFSKYPPNNDISLEFEDGVMIAAKVFEKLCDKIWKLERELEKKGRQA